jgi:gamma-glutamyltranspeptidase/glutathione hydrolase
VGNDANSLQPKKRPLSSMTPTIILQGDRPELIVGAAGGPRIISATLQTILNVLDFQMPVKEAVEAPRIHHQWIPDELNVEDKLPPETKKSLERRGHAVRERITLGVVQAVLAKRSNHGAADSRKRKGTFGIPRSDEIRSPKRLRGFFLLAPLGPPKPRQDRA